MTKEQLAAQINGREYRDEITKSEEQTAKDNNLVVVFGASDDLMEFRGAIYDEMGAWEGTTVYLIKKKGIWTLVDEEQHHSLLSTMEELGVEVPQSWVITAEWAPEGPECSWLIATDIPHATFDIMEDGELYCRGIVFSLNDLK